MKTRCKYPGCQENAEKRGNCRKHYQRHLRAVMAKQVTWGELEKLGLVTTAAPGQQTDYERTLAKAREKAKR